MRNIIVAYDSERAIGRDNDLLWNVGEMRTDMGRFRELTVGQTVIMGRKTLDSIGMALPRRRNIVITGQPDFHVQDVETAHSLDEAFALTDQDNEVFVIGGESIYRQALDEVGRIYATEVQAIIPGADAYFPEIDPTVWSEARLFSAPASDIDKYPFEFITYERGTTK